MANRVITISRQFGSGGRTVGRMTAMKLGIPCYDQELIQKVAEESGFAERVPSRNEAKNFRAEDGLRRHLQIASTMGCHCRTAYGWHREM